MSNHKMKISSRILLAYTVLNYPALYFLMVSMFATPPQHGWVFGQFVLKTLFFPVLFVINLVVINIWTWMIRYRYLAINLINLIVACLGGLLVFVTFYYGL